MVVSGVRESIVTQDGFEQTSLYSGLCTVSRTKTRATAKAIWDSHESARAKAMEIILARMKLAEVAT